MTTRAFRRTQSYIVLALIAWLVVLVMWGVVRSLNWPLMHDAPLMHYIAQQILDGATPYQDIFDMNMPGTYWLHMFTIRLIGGGDAAWRSFDVTWLFLTMLVTFLFLGRISKRAGIVAAFLFAGFYISEGPYGSGQRDYFMLLFAITGAYFLLLHMDNPYRSRWIFLAGLVLGFGVTVKPYALMLAPLLLVVALFPARREYSSLLKNLTFFVAGYLVFPLVALIWLERLNALDSFGDVLFNYLIPYYSKLHRHDAVSALKELISHPFTIMVLAALPVAWSSKTVRRPEFSLTIAGLIYGVLHFVLQKGFFYHDYPYYFFLILIASLLLFSSLQGQKRDRLLAIGGFATIVFFTSVTVTIIHLEANTLSGRKPAVSGLIDDISAYSLVKDDVIQVMDTVDGGIHALYVLSVRQPSRFMYDLHFFHDIDEPYIESLRQEYISSLESKPPKLLILFDRGWGMKEVGFDRLSSFPKLSTLIEKDYVTDISHNGYTIYVHR